MLPSDSDSPICRDWPPCPPQLAETSLLLRKIHHKWRVSNLNMEIIIFNNYTNIYILFIVHITVLQISITF